MVGKQPGPPARDDQPPCSGKTFPQACVPCASTHLHKAESRHPTFGNDDGHLFQLSGVKHFDTPLKIADRFRRYRYISPSTKISILEELSTRAEVDNEDARVVVESLVSQSDLVTELLLDSTDARIRRYMCKLLGSLTSAYQSSWDLKICARIVDLTR